MTLHPWKHTRACMLMQECKDSGWVLLKKQKKCGSCSATYCADYVIHNSSAGKVEELLCGTCMDTNLLVKATGDARCGTKLTISSIKVVSDCPNRSATATRCGCTQPDAYAACSATMTTCGTCTCGTCGTSCGTTCGTKCGTSCGTKCGTSCGTACGTKCGTSCGTACGTKCGTTCGTKCGTSCGTTCGTKCGTTCGTKCGTNSAVDGAFAPKFVAIPLVPLLVALALYN